MERFMSKLRLYSFAFFTLLLCTTAARAEKPNVLFIFADDQAYNTIAAHGNSEIQTPNLDTLAKRGVTFTHAYNMGGYHGAVCVASRTMLNTGLYLWHAQEAEKTLKTDLQEKGQMWSQLLGSAGYDTYFSGKWHIKADTSEIFTVARNVRPGMPNQTPKGYNRPHEGKEDVWKPWDKSFEGFWKGGKHWSEVLGDDAVEYLGIAGKSDKPFFMYLAFNAPHDPRQSPKEFVDRYPLDKLSTPQPFYTEYPHNIGSNHIRDEKLAPFPRTEYAVKVNKQEYYAIITHMDHQIGRILKALEETGKADNTYIVFTADHGLSCGSHGLMGKQNMFEHSMRVPFMVVGPGLAAEKKIDAPIYLQDIMPTTLELADVAVPKHVQFESLLPLLEGDVKSARSSIYGAYTNTQRMVIEGDYKLIVYPQIDVKLLYDLKNDPLEEKNLADEPGQQKRVASLFAKLKSLQGSAGDRLDLDQPKKKPEAKQPPKKSAA